MGSVLYLAQETDLISSLISSGSGPDDERIVVDDYLTIERDPDDPNSYLVRLKAERIDYDADRDIYFLRAREIDTRA